MIKPICGGFLLWASLAHAHVTTADITLASLRALPACLQYQITGVCYWWVTTPTPRIETTAHVQHYLPDAVVSVFANPRQHPWLYSRKLLTLAAHQAARGQMRALSNAPLGGGRHALGRRQDTLSVIFNEVDILGNPALGMLQEHLPLPLHGTSVTAFMPYYQSLWDVLGWRTNIEGLYPQTHAVLSHLVGSPMNRWGRVYPRHGKVVSKNQAMAASIHAMRAAHIITRAHQAHVYQPLPLTCGTACRIARVTENDPATTWQLIFPKRTQRCEVMGTISRWGDALEHHRDGFIWLLWRKYDGCLPHAGQFIGRTTW